MQSNSKLTRIKEEMDESSPKKSETEVQEHDLIFQLN